jgi:teichuronic acid biosynthesis glycosyltransferase TuaH
MGGRVDRKMGGSIKHQALQVVFFSEIKWTYMRTRKQFLLDRLPSSWRVLFLEPFAFGRRNSFAPTRDGRITHVTVPFIRGGTTSALYNKLVANEAARWVLSRLCLLWVRTLFALLRVPSRRVFMVSNPYAADAVLSLRRDLLCYDYNDNPFQFPQTPQWVGPLLERLLKKADLVFVVSRHYLDALAGGGVRNLHLLGNGVEFEHFAKPRRTPSELKGVPRPLLLYTGRISPLLNMDLLDAVCDAFPSGMLFLIGPVDPMTRGDLASLAARPNVSWMDEKPYDELPAYIQAADVCLAPFKFMHQYTVGINPNKIYQYLAAGRPVVSSYIAELREHSDSIFFAVSDEEFLRGIRKALSEPPSKGPLQDLARKNDWSVKAETMAGLVAEALGR